MPDLTILNPARARAMQIWGELVFGSQNNRPDETNGVNKLLLAAIKRQYSSVLPLLRHCTACWFLMTFVERQ